MDQFVRFSAAKDQYGCAVAKVKSPGFRWNRNADQQLLKTGLAEVYVYLGEWQCLWSVRKVTKHFTEKVEKAFVPMERSTPWVHRVPVRSADVTPPILLMGWIPKN